MAEVKVDPNDIEQVQFGQPVVLRFSAFNILTTPELNGTVVRIAADTISDQRTVSAEISVNSLLPEFKVRSVGDTLHAHGEGIPIPAAAWRKLSATFYSA